MSDDINDIPASGMLDQSEIDRLLAQATGEGIEVRPPVLRADGRRGDSTSDVHVEAYDFRNPVFLSELELRRLRLLHEEFIRHLGSRIALFMRMECSFRMTRLATLSHVKFTESLPVPSHICLFKADPLPGLGVITIDPRLALTLVDRMLGGRGHSVVSERQLTEIETSLLEDVVELMLEEWRVQWKAGPELHTQIVGHENNGCFLQTSTRDAVMLVLALEVNFGDCTGTLNLAVPYYMIESVVRDLQARRQQDNTTASPQASPGWKPVYEQISLPMYAEWPVFEASLREIASLRVGDVLELPTGILDDTRVLLAGTEKFTGTVGVEGDYVAVKINRKLPTGISS